LPVFTTTCLEQASAAYPVFVLASSLLSSEATDSGHSLEHSENMLEETGWDSIQVPPSYRVRCQIPLEVVVKEAQVSYGKFLVGLVFLSAAVTQLPAQWGPDSMNSDVGGMCGDIQVHVQDSSGMAVMGATVVTDISFAQATTDSQGMAWIPCRSTNSTFANLEVSAPGYQPARVPMMPYGSSYLEVRLERQEPVRTGPEETISARELSPSIQAESQELLNQAGKAIERKDYDKAQDLLLKAQQLTPSAASVLNNLGVVALHKKDLDAAASWFEKAAHAAPFKPDIVGNLGLIRWIQHRNDESYTLLLKAASMGYDTSLGHYILGTVGLGKGMDKEAAENLKKISSDRYPYRDLYLSIALRNEGKTKAADESYRNFVKRNPVPYAFSVLPKVGG
jgi:hypothetical protein